MNSKSREKFDSAVKLKKEGDFERAKMVLLELHDDEPESPAVLAVLAHVCWDLNQLEEAIQYFRRAVQLRPSSEVVSLGLFHSFLKADRIDEAFDEMRRFLKDNQSEEYSRLLADINQS